MASCVTWSAALGSSGVVLSHPIVALASHITIVLTFNISPSLPLPAGKDAVLLQKAEQKRLGGLLKRVVCVRVQDEVPGVPGPFLYHGEVLFRDGECVGDVRVGSYGHSLGGSVGLGHVSPRQDQAGGAEVVVNKKYLTSGIWEVEVNNKRYPVELSLQPFYDKTNSRIKALE